VGASPGTTPATPGKAVTVYDSGTSSSGSPLIEGGDDQGVTLALALRLMGRGFNFSGDDTPTRLLVGRLPDPLPVPIPLPDGARVVGSQILGSFATIVLDVDLSEDAALAFYRAPGSGRVDASRAAAGEPRRRLRPDVAWPDARVLSEYARPVPLRAGDRQRGRAGRRAAEPDHRPAVLAACVVSPDDRSPSQRGEVGRNKTSGSTAYPAAKAKRDKSMPLKREQSEDV